MAVSEPPQYVSAWAQMGGSKGRTRCLGPKIKPQLPPSPKTATSLAAKRLDAMLKAKNRHGFGVPQVKPPRAMVSSTTSTNMDVDEAERRNSHFRAQPIRTQASTGGAFLGTKSSLLFALYPLQ